MRPLSVFLLILLVKFTVSPRPVNGITEAPGWSRGHTSTPEAAKSAAAAESEFLDSIFSPHAVPLAGIRVLENSLGDVVHDSVLNVLDLLRLRDILLGRGPAPTAYERQKGDLSRNGTVDAQDLNILRDILLHKAGVPYLVDSAGGEVLGDGITITLPPNALDSAVVISVVRSSESEFASTLGVDTKSATADSAYFMASFEIVSDKLDFKLPVNATIKLDKVPPCAYEGLNGLFAAVPDRDGDGKSELFLINDLRVNADSLTITTGEITVPQIRTISLAQAEPGQSLLIRGSGFGNESQNIAVQFNSVAYSDSFQLIPASFVDDSTVIVTVPGSPRGQCKVDVYNVLTALASNPEMFTVLPHSPVTGDIRAIIVNFEVGIAASIDSVNLDSLYSGIEDTAVHNYVMAVSRESRASIDTAINYYSTLPDSLIGALEPLASFIQNLTGDHTAEVFRSMRHANAPAACWLCDLQDKGLGAQLFNQLEVLRYQLYDLVALCLKWKPWKDCDYCYDAQDKAQTVLALTDWIADHYNWYRKCECEWCPDPYLCKDCPKTVFIGFGPQSKAVTGGFGAGGFGTKGCCINIIRYKSNECIHLVNPLGKDNPVPDALLQLIKCPTIEPYTDLSMAKASQSTLQSRPHPGSIIKVTNAQVPYNIVGILNENGKAFIPQVPMNTKITFSMYAPVTGFYDPDVGTYTTGSVPGGFDRPLLLFRPNTTIRLIPIHIADVIRDSVTTNYQRTDYMLNIGASDTGKLLNIGFHSTSGLSFRLEDTEGNFLIDSSNTSCCFRQMRFNKVGIYTVRVGFGPGIQTGSFEFGINYDPIAPFGKYYMCGKFIFDTLYQRYSPYVLEDPIMVSPGDTIFVESGVTLMFDQHGSILSGGVFHGSGQPLQPIILKSTTVTSGKRILSEFNAFKRNGNAGKEERR